MTTTTMTTTSPSRIKGEKHDFKPWTGEYNFDSKPRTTPYDSDEGSFSPARRSVKGRYKSAWWWFTPSGIPFMAVYDNTKLSISEQRLLLSYKESLEQQVADEGMIGFEDFNTDRDSGRSTMRKLKKDPNKDIMAISTDDYALFYGD